MSTASTRPLYGRGAGSTPAEGSSHARNSVESAALMRQRSLVRFQPGVLARGRSSVSAERRGATPEVARSMRVVRFTGLWCNGSMASSNLAGPGSNPGGPAHSLARSSRAEVARVISGEEAASRLLRFESAHSRLHTMTATSHPAAGRSGIRLSPNAEVAGSSPARSVRRPVAQSAEQRRSAPTRPQQQRSPRAEDSRLPHTKASTGRL